MPVRFPSVAIADGHYESVYLKATHPADALAVWIRHTVFKRPGEAPVGSLWVTLFDGDAPAPLAVKETRPAAELATGGDELIRTGAGAVSAHRSSGAMAAGGHTAAWDLTIAGDAPPFAYLPHRALYRTRLPRTKAVSARPAATFSGHVTVADRHLELDGWTGMLGHNWGAEHAERWIWLHGAGLDAVLGRVRVGPLVTPWMANGLLAVGGERRRVGGIGTRVRVDEAPDRCRFEIGVRGGDPVVGEVVAPRRQTIAWAYSDPPGGEHHALHCSIADLRLTAGAHAAETIGGATYELGVRERDHGIAVAPFADP